MELLAPFFARLTGEARTPESSFNERISQLYSKAWSADFLRRLLHKIARRDDLAQAVSSRMPDGGAALLCPLEEVGIAVNTPAAALAAIAAIRARGHHRVVLKQVFGLAGHNALRLWEPELLETQRRWLEHSLRDGRQLVVEPWLERLADFSMQLEMEPAGLRRLGFTGLVTDARGQFLANTAAPNFARTAPPAVLDCLREHRGAAATLRSLFDALGELLEPELRGAGYLGPVGVDAFVYRDAAGQVRLKPVVEINPRYTMGRVMLELMQRVAPGAGGEFRLVNAAALRAEGFASFADYAADRKVRFPLLTAGTPVPRIRSGALPLNDPTQAQAVLAMLLVSDATRMRE